MPTPMGGGVGVFYLCNRFEIEIERLMTRTLG